MGKLGPSLVCSACKMSAFSFRRQLARRIKSKMSAEKRTALFDKHFPEVCDKKGFPSQMATAKYMNDKRVFVDATKMTSYHSQGWSGPDVKTALFALCRHFVDARREELLKIVLKS